MTRSCLVGGALVGLLGLMGCEGRGASPAAAPSGRELAEVYCQGCHMLPEPSELDRGSWERWVLPRMARRLGLEVVVWPGDEEPTEGGEGGRLVREAGVFPDTPRITQIEWNRLSSYYIDSAPESLPPQPESPEITVGIPGFQPRVADFRVASPMVTLLHVEPAQRRIYAGEATSGSSVLAVLDGRGRLLESLPISSAPSHLRVSGDTLSLLLMGMLHPSDTPRGSLNVLTSGGRGFEPDTIWRVEGLRRPVHATYADLSGDGVEDAVVSEFGHLTGRLAWYERLPGGGSRQHTIVSVPGALNTFVRDFDGDGRLDVMALTAQGDEGVSIFRALPGGGFTREWLLRFPASYGSTSIELVDVDNDGHLDIVHTSGDLGDYLAPPRPYHGIRIFLNDGAWGFRQRYFFPMHGAFKAIARDFDADGDIDIAAIAFYPDYSSGAPVSFVYLENVGGLQFRPSTFAGSERGRWLTMAAGDLDGDGYEDLVLGSFAQLGVDSDPGEISARWREPDAPTLIILENTHGRSPSR